MRKLFFVIPLLVLIFLIIFIGPYFKEQAEKPASKYPAPSTYYAMDNVHEVAVNPNRKELYASSLHTPLIVAVDINSTDYPVLGEIKLPGGESFNIPHIVFSSDGSYAYVPRSFNPQYIASWGLQNASYIAVINTTSRKIDRIIYPPYELWGSLVPSSDDRWLYFSTRGASDRVRGIAKLDLQSGEVVGFLPLSIGASFITLSNNGKYIYATQGQHPQGEHHPQGFENKPFHFFTAIDTESLKVVSSVEVGDSPRYIAVTPDGSKAYVSNQWSNTVSVISLSAMKVTANITVGFEPNEIAIMPDGSKAYVSLPGNAQMLAGGPGYLTTPKVAVIDTSRDVLLSSIEVHMDPISVAMDPDGTKVYVADGGANGPMDYAEVHIIDTANDTYLRPIYLRKPAQYAPTGIDVTPDNSKLFVAVSKFTSFPEEWAKGSLLAIDVATGKIMGKLDINPKAVKVSADGSKAYVFSPARYESEAKLFIIDTNSLNIIKSINLGKIGTFSPITVFRIVLNRAETIAYVNYQNWDINFAPKGSNLFPEWVDTNDTGLVAVDLVKDKADKIFYSKTPSVLYKGIALAPDESRLFVSDSASQAVVVINTSTYEEIARIPVGRSPSEVKISKDGKRVYVLQMFGSPMTIIDANTYKVMKSVDFSFVHAQMDFEFSSDERYFYAAGFDSNFVLVYDIQENKVVKVIDTGLDPLDMAITRDGRYIYVGEVTGDKISVIDTTTNTLIKSIGLGKI